ncbi:MAG TPA: response regulator transcription factor [Planctomycetes bacterium]|nr:response regulator transcription factor [Planctomycetota bacterium]
MDRSELAWEGDAGGLTGQQSRGTVFLVVADPRLRREFTAISGTQHLAIEPFSSWERFLASVPPGQPGCLVVDLGVPGVDVRRLFDQLACREIDLGVVVVAAEYDAATVVKAIKAGAVDFLGLPCANQIMWRQALEAATAATRQRREERIRRATVQRRLSHLSQGEWEVLRRILDGKSNRQMAAELGISVRAVEHRRSRVMKKLRVASVADLVRLAVSAEAFAGHRFG